MGEGRRLREEGGNEPDGDSTSISAIRPLKRVRVFPSMSKAARLPSDSEEDMVEGGRVLVLFWEELNCQGCGKEGGKEQQSGTGQFLSFTSFLFVTWLERGKNSLTR